MGAPGAGGVTQGWFSVGSTGERNGDCRKTGPKCRRMGLAGGGGAGHLDKFGAPSPVADGCSRP